MIQKVMKKKQTLLSMAFMALLTGVTFAVVMGDRSFSSLWEAVRNADLRYAGLGAGCMGLFLIFEAAALRRLMRTFQVKVTWRRSLQYSLADFYFSAITPSASGGQPMALFYMMRDGLSFTHASFTLLTTTAMYQIIVLVYGIAMVWAKFPHIVTQPLLVKWLLVLGVLVNGIAAAAILLAVFHRPLVERAMESILRVLARCRVVKDEKYAELRIEKGIEEYSKGGAYLRKYPLVLAEVAALTFFRMTALFAIPYFAAMALGYDQAGILDCIAMQAVLSLAVTAVPLPGSVGASEGTFLTLYRGFLEEAALLPMMALSRGISFYIPLLVSGLAVLRLHFHRKANGSFSGSHAPAERRR